MLVEDMEHGMSTRLQHGRIWVVPYTISEAFRKLEGNT